MFPVLLDGYFDNIRLRNNMPTKKASSTFEITPIFDTAEHLEFNAALPQHLKSYRSFKRDYLGAHAFLYAYRDNKATFNAYRREVERLLHWSWQKSEEKQLRLRAGFESSVLPPIHARRGADRGPYELDDSSVSWHRRN